MQKNKNLRDEISKVEELINTSRENLKSNPDDIGEKLTLTSLENHLYDLKSQIRIQSRHRKKVKIDNVCAC